MAGHLGGVRLTLGAPQYQPYKALRLAGEIALRAKLCSLTASLILYPLTMLLWLLWIQTLTSEEMAMCVIDFSSWYERHSRILGRSRLWLLLVRNATAEHPNGRGCCDTTPVPNEQYYARVDQEQPLYCV